MRYQQSYLLFDYLGARSKSDDFRLVGISVISTSSNRATSTVTSLLTRISLVNGLRTFLVGLSPVGGGLGADRRADLVARILLGKTGIVFEGFVDFSSSLWIAVDCAE
ncbi:hypothetical protein TMatcc_004369 [Talaromyces marneffei ATCC 18224]